MKIIPPTWLLCHTINFSLVVGSLGRSMGFSISPIISTGRIVDGEISPAFQAVRRFAGHSKLVSRPPPVEALFEILRDLFDSNQSSVLDEDQYGRTILYVGI